MNILTEEYKRLYWNSTIDKELLLVALFILNFVSVKNLLKNNSYNCLSKIYSKNISAALML